MTVEELRINAPVIGIVAGAEQLQTVRDAYAKAGMRPARQGFLKQRKNA